MFFFCTASENKAYGKSSNYDNLILKLLPERYQKSKEGLYGRLLHICHFVSMLTDGKALQLFNIIQSNRN